MRLERSIPNVLISSKIRSGRDTLHFSLGCFEMCFYVKIKQSCRSGKLVVFFWCRQDQKGTGGTEIYILETRVRRCALRNAFLMYWSS